MTGFFHKFEDIINVQRDSFLMEKPIVMKLPCYMFYVSPIIVLKISFSDVLDHMIFL